MTTLRLPEGVALFFGDAADARAVKTLWETKLEDAPGHLSHNEVPQYARSWLTAQAVKVDLMCFLHEVWREVWLRPGATPMSLDQIATKDGWHHDSLVSWVTEGDTEGIDRCSYGGIRLASGTELECLVGLTDDGDLMLWAWSLAQPAEGVEGWAFRDDDGYLYADHVGTVANGELVLDVAEGRADAFLRALSG